MDRQWTAAPGVRTAEPSRRGASGFARWRQLAALVLATTGAVVAAQTPPQPVVWLCWYPGATTLACRLGDAPGPAGLSASAARVAEELDVPVPEGRVALPPIVRTILRRPGDLRGRRISIPLFTEPLDMDFARELAYSVMCGANRNCEVRFVDSDTDAARLPGESGSDERE
ncbi:hypothetical protein [Aromatoleum sp.]|uniref:hypothetical protein n=1 Tax=Aromatoleum sp. TaxID=2307007 RepID=UPI002FC86A75